MNWTQSRVMVTGGAGFLGRALVAELERRGVPREQVLTPRSKDFDLRTPSGCAAAFAAARERLGGPIDVVLHAAGFVGGVGANRAFPGNFFHDNMAMGLHLIEAARVDGLAERQGCFVQVGTMCSYPASAPLPYREESLFMGLPDAEIASYGIAKLGLLQMLKAYRQQYGFPSVYCPLVNLYGPGDNVDNPQTTHVAGALVKRFVDAVDAGDAEVVCWGTGSPTRDFVYVDDAAAGLVRAAEAVRDAEAINIASGQEVSIKTFAETILRLAGFRGRVVWDVSKGDGVARRCLDVSRARERLGWSPTVGLEEGLRRTVEWYRGRQRAR